MEVCGTHTVNIARSGLKQLLPPQIQLLSGPGCPVCVTAQGEIDAAIALARMPGVKLLTFGDMIRVPGSESSLQMEQAGGRDIRILYSPHDALRIARENPERQVVFLAVGFETTMPLVAAIVQSAAQQRITNLSFFLMAKLLPPALRSLCKQDATRIDGFLLPGHVTAILGMEPFQFLATDFGRPGVVAGFMPEEILLALAILVRRIGAGEIGIENAYRTVVRPEGNRTAKALLMEVFQPTDATWRGLGLIPDSGLAFRSSYAEFDARNRFSLGEFVSEDPAGCLCGEILRGRNFAKDCPLFDRTCTPETPIGPCMVSSEGSCAAAYRYERWK
jgi:hydrogenase expression/formation protein HypD